MAKIVMELDTENGQATVSVDGQKLDNVSYLSLNRDYYSQKQQYSCCVEQSYQDNGINHSTRMTTMADQYAKASKYNGLYEAPVASKAQLDIADYFMRNK